MAMSSTAIKVCNQKMPAKTILERLGITQGQLQEIYEQEQSLASTARRLGVSKTSIIKYLRDVKKDATPWKRQADRSKVAKYLRSHKDESFPIHDPEKAAQLVGIHRKTFERYLDKRRERYAQEVEIAIDEALLAKKYWIDTRGRKIATAAIESIAVAIPEKIATLVPLYATLRDGTRAVFMFNPKIVWVTQEPSEHSSSEESLDIRRPAGDTQDP